MNEYQTIGLVRLASWAGAILLVSFFAIIVWRLFTGGIRLNLLLYGYRRDSNDSSGYSEYFSPGRTQLLVVTIVTAGYYLLQVIHDPTTFPKIPIAWTVALGGSQAIYLGGKAQSMLLGIRDLIDRRRTP